MPSISGTSRDGKQAISQAGRTPQFDPQVASRSRIGEISALAISQQTFASQRANAGQWQSRADTPAGRSAGRPDRRPAEPRPQITNSSLVSNFAESSSLPPAPIRNMSWRCQ